MLVPVRRVSVFAAALTVMSLGSVASAEPTQVDVRALSKGAKFVGTSMGGVQVTIHDADTGELLADGVTQGSTGDTHRIMRAEQGKHEPVSTDEAAVFHAELDLDEPTRLEVEVYGPLAQRQSANRASLTQWVIPGKHITGGDALTLELSGFVVDVLSPPAHMRLEGVPREVELQANVTMMCGCPIEPGGLWDAGDYEIAATLKRNGESIGETIPLDYAGETSQFQAPVSVDEPGVYEVTVYAYDPADGNTGVDKTTFIIVGDE